MASEDIFFIIIGIIFIFIILMTTFFSSIVLLIIICNWNSQCRSLSNLLIVNSCVAFLVFVLICSIQIPYIFQINEKENNDIYTPFCRIRGFLFLFACIAKLFSYLIQAISRYFIIILYKQKNLLTYRIHGIMIILSWIFSLITSSCVLISPVSFQYEPESRLCILTSKVFHTSFILMIVAFFIPANIIITLYGIILWYTTRNNHVQPNNIATGNNKRNIKVFQNILLPLGIMTIGGAPYLFSIIINKITRIPWPLYLISVLFMAISTAFESLAIFCTNKDVKKMFSAKIGFRQTREMPALTRTPMTKWSITMNTRSTIPINT